IEGVFANMPEPLLEEPSGTTSIGARLRELVRETRSLYNLEKPDTILPNLLLIWDLVQGSDTRSLAPDGLIRMATLRERVAAAIVLASGLRISARVDRPFVAAGDVIPVNVTVSNPGSETLRVQLSLTAPWFAVIDNSHLHLSPGTRVSETLTLGLSEDAAITIGRGVGESATEEALSPLYPHWFSFYVEGSLQISQREVWIGRVRVEHIRVDADFPEYRFTDLQVMPDPSLRPRHRVVALPTRPGQSSVAEVEFLVSTLKGGKVEVTPEAPSGWQVEPPVRSVDTEAGIPIPVAFRVRALQETKQAVYLRARARLAGSESSSQQGFQIIDYPHIRTGAMLENARIRLVPFPCKVPQNLRVGYVAGSGDDVVRAIEALGVPVQHLSRKDLLEGDLSRYDAIVTGVRAYKVRRDLQAAHSRLMSYVQQGGNMVVQYNKLEFNDGKPASPFAPFARTSVGQRRVTAENSPVMLQKPEHILFRQPNVIGGTDWDGWVQERGLYFLDFQDPRYEDLIQLEDTWPDNGGLQGGALVTARVGKGYWSYVGLSLFRQLPAGVPGAYRLLANLLALSQQRGI
ncbi:MAG: hypothetical protein V3T77_02760, partial [Planctomycetota bacterium]